MPKRRQAEAVPYWPGGAWVGAPIELTDPMPPNSSSKKLRLRPNVGVLRLVGSMLTTSSFPLCSIAETFPAWSKRISSRSCLVGRGLRNAIWLVSRDR
jgi:hypothetical protein